jgi:hypothetical protein
MTPIEKLDQVLDLLRDNKPHQLGGIMTELRLLKEVHYSLDELRIALRKLEKDGFVFTNVGTDVFTITLDGYLFTGYVKKSLIDKTSYRRRNVRDFALTWGTVLAGIAASALLIWQVYSYFHPLQIPCK